MKKVRLKFGYIRRITILRNIFIAKGTLSVKLGNSNSLYISDL